MQGTIIGNRYEILQEIGRGSFGTVYKARKSPSDDIVALKIFECADVQEVPYKRFLRSIETSKVLSHPNVIAPFDSGFVTELRPYVVMEYCSGILLSDLLSQLAFLSVDRVVAIACQVCDALDHAHYYGVLHRNLSPSNIMLVRSNNLEIAKVLDFGLAKSFFQCNTESNHKLTVTGEVVGAPEFMSPEQCRQADVDWRSDIYSLGCLIYMMLTGRPPILGDSPIDTMMRQLSDPPMAFVRARAEANVPQSVQDVILRALSKDRQLRQQTMVELRDELFRATGLSPIAKDKISEPKQGDGSNRLS